MAGGAPQVSAPARLAFVAPDERRGYARITARPGQRDLLDVRQRPSAILNDGGSHGLESYGHQRWHTPEPTSDE